jgi:hypothetical protein
MLGTKVCTKDVYNVVSTPHTENFLQAAFGMIFSFTFNEENRSLQSSLNQADLKKKFGNTVKILCGLIIRKMRSDTWNWWSLVGTRRTGLNTFLVQSDAAVKFHAVRDPCEKGV